MQMSEKEKNQERYDRLNEELYKECDNLKKLMDTVDPKNIDFIGIAHHIENIKIKIDTCKFELLDDL